ncbi:putative peroxiredoxinc/MT2298 [Methanoculleus chikugoensis]|jgi:peroxiredoxin|uniref:Putative peroxiredoxinc/MT2298 n=1 Tax=Methanoculleus chikugoensis TaxID=118126 RepID=A0A1M4MMB9_9EURY|nr:redoxin domain-containing protein [Methanoculleus chikugoensis]MDD4567753.1 redoxin domain-containing protein [Methanoculleus chikugoensis]NMA09499.1 redoxin domain-containing protein [Methanomicrobiales archaeon]SCL75997.1 putative peroxiredoxinc/MT2298 [Methanoculleus chikugoensis]
MVVEVGEQAGYFSIPDQNGNTIRLSAFRGKRVLLSFHPLAWTRICAEQMKALEANREAFDALGAVALGISVDSVPCKRAWAGSLGIKKTRLLADFWPHGAVAQMYGVFDSQKGYSRRANVVVDEAGSIIFVAEYPATTVPDMQDVLDALRVPEKRRRAVERAPEI